MSESLYKGMGVFGHVPTPDEVEAKAFVMPRQMQTAPFWAAYACGLSDAGVPDDLVLAVTIAGCKGEFAHNCEPLFSDELDQFGFCDEEVEP